MAAWQPQNTDPRPIDPEDLEDALAYKWTLVTDLCSWEDEHLVADFLAPHDDHGQIQEWEVTSH